VTSKMVLLLFGAALVASVPQLPAQSADVFFQEAEQAPVRPLTPDEKTKLQDPVFRLVLAAHPDVSNLSEIEALIQPDRKKRQIFVVDERIKDPKQPQDRRSVIMFDGKNGDIQLPGNIALSLPFSSAAMPDKDIAVEAWGWDEQNGVYNFYRLDTDKDSAPTPSWKFRGSSKSADRLPGDARAGMCLRCHTSGVPIMKELEFPWNNWHSVVSPATYLTSDAPAEQRWPVSSDPSFPQLSGGEALEPIVKGAITRFNNRRLATFVTGDTHSDFKVMGAKLMLRPLFDTTEINFESAAQKSGLHPIPEPSTAGPNSPIQIPDAFFLQSAVMAGADGIMGIGVSEAKDIGAAAIVQPDEYKILVQQAGLQLVLGDNTMVGDADFAWFTPTAGFAQSQWVDILVQQKVVSPEFVAAVLTVDLENPIFSERRRSLLDSVPDSFTVIPGETYPDSLSRQLISTLESKSPPSDSAEAEFLAVLKTPSPIQELHSRVAAYRDRLAAKLADPAMRQAELQRLFGLLITRRKLIGSFPAPNGSAMFGSLIESRALLPLPASANR
jgi:hypothetical protein